MSTRINLILARASNGVIGKANALPWHLPEDLQHFREQTAGAPVIMGRRTWDSLPPKFRPLPDRTNIVVTRQRTWSDEGALRASNLRDAVAQATATGAPEAWVMGGAQIYGEAMSFAQRAIVTEIDRAYDGDAFAPMFNEQWRETAREAHHTANGLKYSFVTLERA